MGLRLSHRSPRSLALAAVVVAAAIGVLHGTTSALAQPATPDARQPLKLEALGGAVIDIPAWRAVRHESGVAIYEQLPDPATQRPYYVLVCTIEEGPPKGQPIAWDKVRDNIVQSASKNQRALTLEVKDAFTGAATFEGRRFLGELKASSPDKKVQVELVALAKDGKLVTIGIVSDKLDGATAELLAGIARSARLGP